MAESDSKRRPFRSLGLRLRSFGRNVFRTYSPADSSPQSTNDVSRPSWQQNTEIPLLWDEQSNDNALPQQQPYTEVLPAPDQQPQRRMVTPQQRRSPQLPQQNQPRQQQPQQPQQVQRTPQQESDDERLYRIMAFHRERQAKSEAIKANVQAKREETKDVSPPRRRRPSFDYVDTRSIGGEDTPESSQDQVDDNAPDDWDLPPIDDEADVDTVQLSASDEAPVQRQSSDNVAPPPRRQPDVVQRDSVPQQLDNTAVDESFDGEQGDEDFLAPELDYDEVIPEAQEQPQSLSSDPIQPARIIQRSPIADVDDSNDYIEDTPPTYDDHSPADIDNNNSQPSSMPMQQSTVQRDYDNDSDETYDESYQSVETAMSDGGEVQRYADVDGDHFDDSDEVETGFDGYAQDDNAPIETNTQSPVQLQRQADDPTNQASVQREVYEGDADSDDEYYEDDYVADDYQNDEGQGQSPVDAPRADVQQSVQREVYEGDADSGDEYYEEEYVADDYQNDEGQNQSLVDMPSADVQQSVQREVYDDDASDAYYEADYVTDDYQNDGVVEQSSVDMPRADSSQAVQRDLYDDDASGEYYEDHVADDYQNDGVVEQSPVDMPRADAPQAVQREVYDDDASGEYYDDGYQNEVPVDTPSADGQTVQRTIDHHATAPTQSDANVNDTSAQSDFPRTAQELPSTHDDGDFAEWVQDVSDDPIDVQRDYDDGYVSQDRSSSPRRAVISEVNTEDYDHLYDTHIPSYHNEQVNKPVETGHADVGQPPSVNTTAQSTVQRELSDGYDAPQPAQWVNSEPDVAVDGDNTFAQTPSAPDVAQSPQHQIVQRNHDVVPTQSQSPMKPSQRNDLNNDDVEIVFPGDHVQRAMNDGDGHSNQVDLYTALQQAGVVPPSAGDSTPVQRRMEDSAPPNVDRSAFPSDIKAYGSVQDISSQTQHTVSRDLTDSPVADVSASIDDSDETDDGQPDIDKIARDVYNRLKNRLRIERERRHSK